MLDTETQLTSTPPYHLNQFIYHITTSSSITVHSSQVKTPSGNHRVQFAALLLAAAVALLLLRADTDFPLVSHPDSVEESLTALFCSFINGISLVFEAHPQLVIQ